MENRVWILGASDPEMSAIESLLMACGETVRYATRGGRRVAPGEAYRMDTVPVDGTPWGGSLYLVECGDASVEPYRLVAHPASAGLDACEIPSEHYVTIRSIDHHRPGDTGHGRPAAEFFSASAIGQVIIRLACVGSLSRARWPMEYAPAYDRGCVRRNGASVSVCVYHDTENDYVDAGGQWAIVPSALVLTAAADHCLGHAYAGRCPGVDPDALLRHRVEQQVAHRACAVCGGTGGATGTGGIDGYPDEPCHGGPYVSVESVLADIEAAHATLCAAPHLVLAEHLCDWHAAGHRRADDCLTSTGSEYSDDPCREFVARDMRGTHVPGLPDAGTRYAIPYVADGLPGPDGRRKIVCSGDAETIRAFRDWAKREGLVDAYGDPERGFAGAYSTVAT